MAPPKDLTPLGPDIGALGLELEALPRDLPPLGTDIGALRNSGLPPRMCEIWDQI